jgi:intracellular sulfur oxidation DsrE/DsrF family protein
LPSDDRKSAGLTQDFIFEEDFIAMAVSRFHRILLAATVMTALVAAGPVFAGAAAVQMPVPGYGIPFDTKAAAERPDSAVRYRVVFNATRAAPKPGDVLPTLERAARLLNLFAQEGVHVQPGDVVIVVSGQATPGVLTDAAYARRADDPQVHANPNLPLIDALQKAGAVVSVCSQALQGQKINTADVAPAVRRDVSAMTTLANLQLRGYALIPE